MAGALMGRSVDVASGRRTGEILVAAGTITPEQLEEALLVRREDPREVEEILLSLGYLTKGDLARALARREAVRQVSRHAARQTVREGKRTRDRERIRP
jgi:hypothetical protein